MSDIERRLRAAMIAAAERWSAEQQSGGSWPGGSRLGGSSPGSSPGSLPRGFSGGGSGPAGQWPAGLLEGIRRRHRRHVQRVTVTCVAVGAAILLAVPPVAHALRPGRGPVRASATSPATTPRPAASATKPSSVAAPGTVLRDCGSANWGQLPSNWRSTSMQVGPILFAYDRPHGYVHPGDTHSGTGNVHPTGKPLVGVMIVEVSDGATVVMKVDPGSRPYFRFVPYFDQAGGYALRNGVTGLTFASCPRGSWAGDNGQVTDYYLGFVMLPGSRALVNIWPSAAATSIPVTFTCVKIGCGT